MKKIIFLLVAALFFTNMLKAQVPGFDGKKFSFYYNGSFSLRSSNPGYISDFATYNFNEVGLNYRHNFDADYVVTRDLALGVGFKLLRTAINGSSIVDE